jgi:hypothetical protein
MNLEQFNKTGLRDVYNVLKHLENVKDESINTRKGGKHVEAEDKSNTNQKENLNEN